MTPEEVLVETVRLRWPESIPDEDYPALVHLVMGFFDVLRSAAPTKRRTRKAAPTQHPANSESPIDLRAAIRARILMRPWSITELMADLGGGMNYQAVWGQLKALRAKRIREGRTVLFTLAPSTGTPKPKRKAGGHQVPLTPADKEAVRKILQGGPVSAKAGAKAIGRGAASFKRLALELGAHLRGRGPGSVWELPPNKEVG